LRGPAADRALFVALDGGHCAPERYTIGAIAAIQRCR
jgi:hypothetical protein